MTPAQRTATATALATALAVPAEGLRRIFYYDPPGVLTVCYGHTGSDIDKSKTYSIEECKGLLNQDMLKAVNIVERCVPGLPVKVLAAFADAVFNMGPTIACDTKNSTAARMLRSKRFIDACEQLPRWNKAKVLGVMVELPGLTKRRGEELALCVQMT